MSDKINNMSEDGSHYKDLALSPGDKALHDVLKAEFRANTLFPQMWAPIVISTANAFLKGFLKEEITFEYFKSFESKLFVPDKHLEKVNKVHTLYNVPELELDKVTSVFGNSRTFAIDMISKFLIQERNETMPHSEATINFFREPSNKPEIENLSTILQGLVKVMNSSESTNLSKEYKESLEEFSIKMKTKFLKDDQSRLDRYWQDVSKKLTDLLTKAVDDENSKLKNPFDDEKVNTLKYEIKISTNVITRNKLPIYQSV